MIRLFLLLTFSISWPAWLILSPAYGDLVMGVPGVVALGLTLYKKRRVRNLFGPVSWAGIGLGAGLPFVIFFGYLGITSLFSLSSFSLPIFLQQLAPETFYGTWGRFLLFGLGYMLAVNLLFAAGEELGWRAYLLRRLKERLPNFWARSMALGLLWGAWHLPLYIMDRTPPLTFFVFMLNVCLIAVCYTWLYERHFSVWTTTIAHGVHNMLFNGVLVMITPAQEETTLWQAEEGLIVTLCYGAVIGMVLVIKKMNAVKRGA